MGKGDYIVSLKSGKILMIYDETRSEYLTHYCGITNYLIKTDVIPLKKLISKKIYTIFKSHVAHEVVISSICISTESMCVYSNIMGTVYIPFSDIIFSVDSLPKENTTLSENPPKNKKQTGYVEDVLDIDKFNEYFKNL